MTPFWRTFCFDLSNYGKNGGAIFFLTCLALVLIPTGIAILMEQLGDYFPWAAGGIIVLLIAFAIRAIRRARRDRLHPYQIQPMAREEIRRARSKLIITQPSKRL